MVVRQSIGIIGFKALEVTAATGLYQGTGKNYAQGQYITISFVI